MPSSDIDVPPYAEAVDNPPAGVEPQPPGHATVKVGRVETDDQLGAYTLQEKSPGGITVHCEIRNRYERDRHVYALPVAYAGNTGNATFDTTAFVQLANPTLLWVCDWTLAKAGVQPPIPKADPPPNGWVLLDQHYVPVSIPLYADGQTPLYRISGTFVYGCKRPDPVAVRDLRFPVPPWLDPGGVTGGLDRTMPEAFEDELLMHDQATGNREDRARGRRGIPT